MKGPIESDCLKRISKKLDLRQRSRRMWELMVLHRLNILFIVVIIFAGSIYSFHLSGTLPKAFLDPDRSGGNIWFQSDMTRVMDNMTMRLGDQSKTRTHPLFTLYTYPPTFILMKLGFSTVIAIRLVTATIAGLWLGMLAAVMLVIGMRRLDTIIFVCLASVSASFVFLTSIPETFPLGGVSITAVLLVAAVAQRRKVSRFWQTATNAFSLSVTVTNWMAGILSAFILNDSKRAKRICIDGFLVVTLLWAVEKFLFPSAGFFLVPGYEIYYVLMPTSAGPIGRASVLFVHSIVMPGIDVLENTLLEGWPRLSIEHASLSSHSASGAAAIFSWLFLLTTGAVWAWRSVLRVPFFLIVGGVILGQLILHLVFGDETFLYSLHWLSPLIIVAAAATFTRYRTAALAIAAGLVVLLAINNLGRFRETAALLETFA